MSMAAFGVPVVPPVYCRAMRSFLGLICTFGGLGSVVSTSCLNLRTWASVGILCLGTARSRLPIMRLVVGRYSPMVAAMRFLSLSLPRTFVTTGWSRSR